MGQKLSIMFYEYGNLCTARSQRAQRLGVVFYPTVRGGRIKRRVSASGRNLHIIRGCEALALATLTARAIKHLLCELRISNVLAHG